MPSLSMITIPNTAKASRPTHQRRAPGLSLVLNFPKLARALPATSDLYHNLQPHATMSNPTPTICNMYQQIPLTLTPLVMSAHCTQNPKTLAQLAAEPRSLIFLKVTRNTQGADPNAIVHKLSEFYLTKFALDGTIKEGPDIEEWKSILNPIYDSKAGAFVLNTAESLATAAGAYKTFVVKYVDVKDNTEHAFALQFTEKSEIKAKG
jgi:hypothetical protein